MGRPFTIQEDDDRRLLELKAKLGASTKIEVLRLALTLLEHDLAEKAKHERWQEAAKKAAASSREVNAAFRTNARIKRDDS